MTEMPDAIQTTISEVTRLYEQNATLTPGELDPTLEGRIVSGYTLLNNGLAAGEGFDSNSDLAIGPDSRFMLGSITKLFVMRELARALAASPADPEAKIFPAIPYVIREAINRGQLGYLLAHAETYGPVLEWMDLPAELIPALTSADISTKETALQRISDESLVDWHNPEFPQVMMNFADLCYWTLTVSMDSTLAVAKGEYIKRFGDFNQLQQAVDHLVSGLEMTITTANFQHWVQSGANTVSLPQLTAGMETFVTEVVNDPFAEAVHDAVTNNHLDFGFNFSSTPAAADLEKSGAKVVEKTGLYPDVIWIRALAEQGLPPHMVLSSIISVAQPNGSHVTVGLYMNIEVALSGIYAELGYPDDSSAEYAAYIEAMEAKYFPVFRAKLIELVSSIAG